MRRGSLPCTNPAAATRPRIVLNNWALLCCHTIKQALTSLGRQELKGGGTEFAARLPFARRLRSLLESPTNKAYPEPSLVVFRNGCLPRFGSTCLSNAGASVCDGGSYPLPKEPRWLAPLLLDVCSPLRWNKKKARSRWQSNRGFGCSASAFLS